MWDNKRMDKLLEEICDFYNHLDDLGELHDSFSIRDTRSRINSAEDVFIEAVEFIKEEKWKELDKEDDPHIACFSYPNCDEAPLGCIAVMGSDVEPYGNKD